MGANVTVCANLNCLEFLGALHQKMATELHNQSKDVCLHDFTCSRKRGLPGSSHNWVPEFAPLPSKNQLVSNFRTTLKRKQLTPEN
jgi:hypothetical protein